MRPYVIIATKGRAQETRGLLDYLQRQTLPPAFTLIVGSEAKDLEGCHNHPLLTSDQGDACVSPRLGTSCQRNVGLETLQQRGFFEHAAGDFFCTFFDDDFRPDADWLKNAAARFEKGDIVGLTGRVIADGVMTSGFNEHQAAAFLDGTTPPLPHWANQTVESEVACAYGCNMAFIGKVVRQNRFEENLPLYSWQEDYDYTGQCLRLGRVVRVPNCVGVHMGSPGGRTSGLRFGYSQIANPLYLMKKGTMSYGAGIKQMTRNLAANTVKSFIPQGRNVDYKGRLRGNLRAMGEILPGRINPLRILEPDF